MYVFWINWIFGVLGNLVASWIYDSLKLSPIKGGLVPTPIAEPSSFAVEAGGHSNPNRRKFSRAVEHGVYRFFSLYVLYAGFALPLMFKAVTLHREVLFSDIRFIGFMLPNAAFRGEFFQPVCVLLAISMSFPTADLAQALYVAYDRKFGPVSHHEWVIITMGAHVLVAACVASAVTYLYYQISFLQAVGSVLIAVGAPFVFGNMKEHR